MSCKHENALSKLKLLSTQKVCHHESNMNKKRNIRLNNLYSINV